MTDREFWLLIRRALMMVVKAIEKKYPIKGEPLEVDGSTSIS